MKNNKTLYITMAITLLPIIFAVMVYDQLPETIATHWGADGMPDGWSPRWFVFLLPVLLAALQWVIDWKSKHGDARWEKAPQSVRNMMYWLVPAVSLLGMAMTLTYAMGVELNILLPVQLLVGLLLTFLGNYLPKTRQNSLIGIKLPWTLKDADNWNFTHRVAGRVWMIGGVAMMIGAFAEAFWLVAVVLLVIVAATVGASLWYEMRQRK